MRGPQTVEEAFGHRRECNVWVEEPTKITLDRTRSCTCGLQGGQVCLECGALAVWVRHTQFSGDHPYCEEHARKEKNFGREDPSYFLWRRVDSCPGFGEHSKLCETICERRGDCIYLGRDRP